MPNRIVRDGINASKVIDRLNYAEEVFYRRLITVVDDFGRYDADPAILKAALYPRRLDKIREADVLRWLVACHKAEAIVLYEIDSKPLLVLLKAEKPRAKYSKFPQPPAGVFCWRRGAESPCQSGDVSAYDNICAHMRPNANTNAKSISNTTLTDPHQQKLPFGPQLAPLPSSLSLEQSEGSSVVVEEPMLADTDDPVLLLVDRGFTAADASKLLERSMAGVDRVREVIAHARGKKKGFIVEALRRHWTFEGPAPGGVPIEAGEAKAARERLANVDRDRKADLDALDAAIDRLGESEWAELVNQIKPSLREGIRQRIDKDGPAAVRLARVVRETVYGHLKRKSAIGIP